MLFKSMFALSSCVAFSTQSVLPVKNDLNLFSTRSIQVNQQTSFSLVCDQLQIIQQKTDDCRQEIVEGHSDLRTSIAKLDQLRQEYSVGLQSVSGNCLTNPCSGTPNDLGRFKSSLASCLQSLNSVVSYMSNQFSGSFELSCKPIFSNLWATLQPVFASAQSVGTDMKSFLSGLNLNYDAFSKLDFGISSFFQHSSSGGFSIGQGLSSGSGSTAGQVSGATSGAGSSYGAGVGAGASAGLQGGAAMKSGQGVSVGSGHGAGEVSGQAGGAATGAVSGSGSVNGGEAVSGAADAGSKGSVGITFGQGAGVGSGQGAGVSSGQAAGTTSGYGSGGGAVGAGGSGSVSSYGAGGGGAGAVGGVIDNSAQGSGASFGSGAGGLSGYGAGADGADSQVQVGINSGAGAGAGAGFNIGGDAGFDLGGGANFAGNAGLGAGGLGGITISQFRA